jgi:hypothetical protein
MNEKELKLIIKQMIKEAIQEDGFIAKLIVESFKAANIVNEQKVTPMQRQEISQPKAPQNVIRRESVISKKTDMVDYWKVVNEKLNNVPRKKVDIDIGKLGDELDVFSQKESRPEPVRNERITLNELLSPDEDQIIVEDDDDIMRQIGLKR